MSGLRFFKPRPAQYVENGQDTALRNGKTFIFDANIIALGTGAVSEVRFITGASAIVFSGGEITITQDLQTRLLIQITSPLKINL